MLYHSAILALFILEAEGRYFYVSPTKGPLAGGTLVNITVYDSQNPVETIYISQTVCEIQSTTEIESDEKIVHEVLCKTQEFDNEQYNAKIRVTFKNEPKSVPIPDFTFSYLPNPTIKGFSRSSSIMSGGLDWKVSGDNLDSVEELIIRTYVLLDDNKALRVAADVTCNVLNAEMALCKTPTIHPNYWKQPLVQLIQRRLTLTAEISINPDVDTSKLFPDGFKIYEDPIVDSWKDIKQYDPKGTQPMLHLHGDKLDYAASQYDYTVTIGNESCDVQSLFTNTILCKPPSKAPGSEQEVPIVTVSIGDVQYIVGSIKYIQQAEREDSPLGVILGGVISAALIVIALVVAAILYRRNRTQRKHRQARIVGIENSNGPATNHYSISAPGHDNMGYVQPISSTASNPQYYIGEGEGMMIDNVSYAIPRRSIPSDILDAIDEDLALAVNECILDSDRMEIGETVGKGFFGSVYKGTLKEKDPTNNNNIYKRVVAIKTVQGTHFSMKDVTSFLEEAVVMKDFNHSNVLSLIGVIIDDNKPYVILPFMELGDLKSYIAESDRRITVRELASFGVQISCGMDYLAQQKFVHRDLATRNCMINKSLVIKIADFGLSRDIYKSDYYRVEDKKRPLPVKWMAIESLTEGVFSSKTDVWSFGVLLWELMTRGCSPYSHIDSFSIKAYLNSGRRLTQPEHAPDDIYALMSSCWKHDPDERPTFTQLHEQLIDIVNDKASNASPGYLVLL